MNATLLTLLGIHVISLLFMIAVLAEYGHLRKKERAFVQDIDALNATLMRRSLLAPVYALVIVGITTGSIVLYLWQPHLL